MFSPLSFPHLSWIFTLHWPQSSISYQSYLYLSCLSAFVFLHCGNFGLPNASASHPVLYCISSFTSFSQTHPSFQGYENILVVSMTPHSSLMSFITMLSNISCWTWATLSQSNHLAVILPHHINRVCWLDALTKCVKMSLLCSHPSLLLLKMTLNPHR